jgi:hypothetical protein
MPYTLLEVLVPSVPAILVARASRLAAAVTALAPPLDVLLGVARIVTLTLRPVVKLVEVVRFDRRLDRLLLALLVRHTRPLRSFTNGESNSSRH